jgi:hypothetical protein
MDKRTGSKNPLFKVRLIKTHWIKLKTKFKTMLLKNNEVEIIKDLSKQFLENNCLNIVDFCFNTLDKKLLIIYNRNGQPAEVTINQLGLYQLLQLNANVEKFDLNFVLTFDVATRRTWREYFDSLGKREVWQMLADFFAISYSFPLPVYETQKQYEKAVHIYRSKKRRGVQPNA